MIASTQTAAVPVWVKLGLRTLPLPVVNTVLQRLMLEVVRGHPEMRERLGPYAATTFLIQPTDIPIQFCLRLDSPAPIVCQRRPATCAWDARIAGPFVAFLAMVHGVLDGDALFFSRDITIEGNTDAVLAIRNAIDAAEIDLPCEVASLFGPLSPVTRKVAKIATPIVGRLFEAAASRWGVHAV